MSKKKKKKLKGLQPEKKLKAATRKMQVETAKAVESARKQNHTDKTIREVELKQKKDIKDFTPLKIIGTNETEAFSPATKPVSRIRKAADKIGTILVNWSSLIKWLLISLSVLIILAAGGVFVIFQIWGKDLPDVSKLKDVDFAETTTIYDREGNVLYRIYKDENRTYVPLKDINKKVIDATISIEDKNFYNHFGFDLVGIIRAQLNNLNEENSVQGASTLTQQLAKNIYLSPEKSFDRKVKELIIAVELEWYYSKDEILELYFNKIPYGSNAFGIEAASKTFFNKPSSELTLVEASILAALPKATSRFSPYGNNKKELMGYCKVEECESPDDGNYVWGRKDLVLQRMLEDGKISKNDLLEAWREGFNVKFADLKLNRSIQAPHFVFYVRDYLEKKYGKEIVESGGLEVKTTLDPVLQANAEKIITERYEQNVKNYGGNNAALVSLDPKTGGVLAMVGSANYWDESIDGQVNVATSLRQPGSTFKPLVYATAIENAGIGSGTILGDYKTKFGDNYIPVNSDNAYRGRMAVRQAIDWSRNIPAIKAYYLAGEEPEVLKFINKLGVTSLQEFKDQYNKNPDRKWDFSYGPAMAIGSGEVKLLDLAGAYAAFPNGGRFNPVNPILEIKDRDGEILEKFQDKSTQAMMPETAFIINSILSDVAAKPAGSWRNILTIPGQNLASKTGTSNKKIGKANYPNNLLTIGYTPTILSATWVGNSDGKQLSVRAWGEFTAAPINKAFMEMALKDKPLVEYEKPDGIIEVAHQFYPPNWDRKKNYDSRFKPLSLKDCTDDERSKDPQICKSKEQMAKEAKDKADKAANNTSNGAEKPLGSGNTLVIPPKIN